MEKFICIRCLKCCNSFDAKDSDYPRFAEDSSIIVFSAPRLIVHDWEKEFFNKDDLAVGNAVYDLKNNLCIVLNYNIKAKVCPNLNNEKCKIYFNRPISCKLFPCPFRGIKNTDLFSSSYGFCKAEINKENLSTLLGTKTASKKELLKNIYSRYGSGFIYGIISDLITQKYMEMLNTMEQKGEIKLVKSNYPLNFLIKRISNSERIDISDIFNQKNNFYLHSKMLSDEYFNSVKNKIVNI